MTPPQEAEDQEKFPDSYTTGRDTAWCSKLARPQWLGIRIGEFLGVEGLSVVLQARLPHHFP